ncbi:hypothetical protein [Aliikangiella sp. IMCC44359]|uniref:hypothetical protein n=1 Tax=Aliikangiella sp. IMCC44359 TaxID=3459125 RepID=UPI00403AB634
MKKIIGICLLLIMNTAIAQKYKITDRVKLIDANASTTGGDNYFLVENFHSAGSCPTIDNHVKIAIKDDRGGNRQIALLLTAKLTEQVIGSSVYDTYKNTNGDCIAWNVKIIK